LQRLLVDFDLFSVRIHRTPVLGKRCYEQAYVSYIDHPSAFFLQLAHYEKEYKELHEKIK
jgi:hypothetical protein